MDLELSEKVFIISAPSGAGKTTLVTALLKRYPYFEFSISATTRLPRSYEIEGQHYYFMSLEEFQQKRSGDDFLEWEEVYPGRFYGTLWSEIKRIQSLGKFPIFDVDVEGGLNIKQKFGEGAISIFIQPPSLDVLRQRLIGRGTDSEAEIERRFNKAKQELAYAHRFDYVLVNDQLDQAIEELCALVMGHLEKI